MRSLTILFATLLSLTSAIVADDKTADLGTDLAPAVLARAKEIHADFKGQEGYIAQFGDSITYSMAFWSPMSWDDPGKYLPEDDLPNKPESSRWRDWIKGARDKGVKFSNYSGWRVGNLLKSVDAVLTKDRPEAAMIMIGTNDISGGKVPADYKENLEQVIAKCIAAHCIPILNTIPPRRGKDEAVEQVNTIVRDIASEQNIPLVDYHAAIVKLRPDKSWDGTLISKDGVHPSGGKSNVYDSENLHNCGYALRNWINFLVVRQLHFKVLKD